MIGETEVAPMLEETLEEEDQRLKATTEITR
jgi:hypothetical protein